eukprot:9308037-Pyramimonas_sp.AAC.1
MSFQSRCREQPRSRVPNATVESMNNTMSRPPAFAADSKKYHRAQTAATSSHAAICCRRKHAH